MHCIYRNCLNTFWHSNIGVFKNNMLWFVCFVLKYILPVCDGPKEDLQESTLYFFLPLYAKHMENVVNTRFLKEGIDIVILGVVESQLCTTGWQEVKIRGTGITLPCWSLHYFGLNVKQISSALTRPTGTWLEPASLALPWLTPPQQIMDPTWISSGWGGWICAPKHKTACINDTLPFTHLMKKKKKCIERGHIHRWEVKLPVLVFFSPPFLHLLISWLQPIVPAFLSQEIRWDAKKIIWCVYSRDDKI